MFGCAGYVALEKGGIFLEVGPGAFDGLADVVTDACLARDDVVEARKEAAVGRGKVFASEEVVDGRKEAGGVRMVDEGQFSGFVVEAVHGVADAQAFGGNEFSVV